LSLEDPAHRARITEVVTQMNTALAEGRAEEALAGALELEKELAAAPYKSRYYNVKKVRDEVIRLGVLTGRFDDALQRVRAFYPLQDLDYRCPNRVGILKAMEGRVLLEAGKMDNAERLLREALQDTRRWLGYMDRFSATSGPVGPGPQPPVGVPGGRP
jgi:hypothetical protein